MSDLDDASFCKQLPKTELHAHLTGSIFPSVLHEIWLEHKRDDPKLDIEDPAILLEAARTTMSAESFFPLFSSFIYRLCNSKRHIAESTASVLSNFRADGVQYLELRTIPRPASDLTKEQYIQTVLDVISTHRDAPARTYLILGVDRKDTAAEALDTVQLAIKYRPSGVVGVDLAGNPAKGDVGIYEDAFRTARDAGLKVTLHFAEVQFSSRDEELRTLLRFGPDRLGHVIRVPGWARDEIRKRKIGLELCLTCNVSAKMTEGGFGRHHFGWWRDKGCPIAICTDDVGIFGSTTSNEYSLLMKHFGLNRREVVELSRSSVDCIFGTEEDKRRLQQKLTDFASPLES